MSVLSEERAEIVARAWFARLGAGDPAPDMCDPAIEIRNWAESPVPGPYQGHEGLQQWWRAVNDPDMGVEIQMFRLEEIIELDEERVVTIQRATGRGRASGFEIDQRWGAILTVRNGKVVSAVGYPSPDATLRAAGLIE